MPRKKEEWKGELKCPLCCERSLQYTELKTMGKKPDDQFMHMTHAWVCSLCPAVLFEYWDKRDTKALSKFLK